MEREINDLVEARAFGAALAQYDLAQIEKRAMAVATKLQMNPEAQEMVKSAEISTDQLLMYILGGLGGAAAGGAAGHLGTKDEKNKSRNAAIGALLGGGLGVGGSELLRRLLAGEAREGMERGLKDYYSGQDGGSGGFPAKSTLGGAGIGGALGAAAGYAGTKDEKKKLRNALLGLTAGAGVGGAAGAGLGANVRSSGYDSVFGPISNR